MSDLTLYDADEAAAILRCTASWLKDKARKREIPFTMPGGSYRWTPGHIAEIIRLFEQRPVPRASAPVAARRTASGGGKVEMLQARPPRRLRGAA